MNYLVDANILLRVQDKNHPTHQQCMAAVDLLRNKGEDLCVCAQILAEFWSVLTRPRNVNGWGLPFEDAVVEIGKVRETFPCLSEPPDIADRWQNLVIANKVMGRQAHDARIAALMSAHGLIHILTLNPADFRRYQMITPLTPSDVLSR